MIGLYNKILAKYIGGDVRSCYEDKHDRLWIESHSPEGIVHQRLHRFEVRSPESPEQQVLAVHIPLHQGGIA